MAGNCRYVFHTPRQGRRRGECHRRLCSFASSASTYVLAQDPGLSSRSDVEGDQTTVAVLYDHSFKYN
jgi:hypothetical protein